MQVTYKTGKEGIGMKTILKKIMCASLGAAVLLSQSCAFANQLTDVPIDDYMYDAKTVYVDDNLEGGSLYPISAALNSSNSVTEEETGNTAVKLNGWNSVVLMSPQQLIDGDKIVVSFGVKPSGADFAEAIASGTFDKTLRAFIAYGIYAGGTGETGALGFYSGTTLNSASEETLQGWMSWGGKGATIVVPQTNRENDGYVKVVAVYERVKNEDSDGYKVYMRSLSFNGKEVLTEGGEEAIAKVLKSAYSEKANWWSDTANNTIKIQSRTGAGTLDNYYDNFLVYVPEDFKIKNMEYSDDNMSARAQLTIGAKLDDELQVNLISEDGESKCSVEAGENRKELVLNFPNALDVENRSYYISIDGLKALTGETKENERYLISRKSANVANVYAEKSETGITGRFYVNAVENKTVYAVMSVWNENSCMDFKVREVELNPDAGEVPVEINVELDNKEEAKKVQMFFVDSVESMKLVSDVREMELW